MRPEETIHIVKQLTIPAGSTSSSEVDLVPLYGTSSQVPLNKYARVFYGLIITNPGSTVATITIYIYPTAEGATKEASVEEASVDLIVGATSTLLINRDVNSPILVVPAGRYVKAVASVPSAPSANVTITLLMNAYDV